MDDKKKFHLIFGLIMLILGAYGAYDERINTQDFLIGIMQPGMIVAGAILVFIAVYKDKHKIPLIALGAVLLFVGLYGLYDEWFAVVDCWLGLYAPASIAVGTLCLLAGIRKLKT